ncbi:unnamed protein product [Didymodactylos carnosus]|uniref:SET domain-containing protein n=1 Tax=Didymodactylos carnosus TaxID=1234261 RepID=A0A8S2TCF0_9BILA|nr:unnamed protein product [Didymodactylos carnosus]CAF4283131.1 unnamed protein product [Didymodactylos carnosus]
MKRFSVNTVRALLGTSFTLNTDRHMHTCAKGVRRVITYGALMNHSCDPNCYSDRTYQGLKKGQETAVIALRDIHADDEITIDYNLAEYDMEVQKSDFHQLGFVEAAVDWRMKQTSPR